MNYFKVVGPKDSGLGKAKHCFPFRTGAEKLAAMAEASMLAATMLGTRIVAWKRDLDYLSLPVVGDVPAHLPLLPMEDDS